MYFLLDTAILAKARNNDEAAIASLVKQFSPIIRAISRSYFIYGGDGEDLYQMGLIGFYDALKSFDETKNVEFTKYAKVCIHNKILDAVKESTRKKHLPLNNAVEYDTIKDADGTDPEKIFLVREQLLSVYSAIDFKLSDYEKYVLNMYIDGFSYPEISQRVGKSVKSVTNAIARIRNKLI